MTRDGRRFTIDVAADGGGPGVWRVGAVRERACKHDPGRVIRDLAVMLADGGDCLTDPVRGARPTPPFGAVASNATAFRVIDQIAADVGLLDALRAARATAREHAWTAGAAPDRVVIEIDATLIGAHSEKEGAAGNFKGGFGYAALPPPRARARAVAGRQGLLGVERPK